MIERFLVAYLLAVVHELCHFGVARAIGLPVQGFSFRPWGSALILPTMRYPWQELAVSMAGPAFHLVMIPFACQNESFFMINTAILFANIIPALPLDGGRMMKAVLLMHLPAAKAYRLSLKITWVTTALLFGVSFLEALFERHVPMLAAIPIFLIFSHTSIREEQTIGLMRRLSKGGRKKKIGRFYLASADTKAIRICSELFLDRENMVLISSASGIYGIMDEKTILKGLEEWGSAATFRKIFANMVEKTMEIG